MAGSRRQNIGNILQRFQGLLKSGALKEEDCPIWYDVVKAFPPRSIPSPKPVQNILYPEDFVRVHYSRTYYDTGMMNLTNKETKTVPERFVDTYMEIHRQKVVPNSEILDKTASLLKEKGFRLVTHEEKAAADKVGIMGSESGDTKVERLQQKRESTQLLPRSEEMKVNVNNLFSDKT